MKRKLFLAVVVIGLLTEMCFINRAYEKMVIGKTYFVQDGYYIKKHKLIGKYGFTLIFEDEVGDVLGKKFYSVSSFSIFLVIGEVPNTNFGESLE